MTLHYIWFSFFALGFAVALYKYAAGQEAVFDMMVKAMLENAQHAVTISLSIVGVMALFLGMMRIGEAGGAVTYLARWAHPILARLFPSIPKGDKVMGEMMMNFTANFLGLDNAATPFGLKAMQSLQARNPQPECASKEQIMFVALHSSGLTLIPVSVIAQRTALGSAQPTAIFIPTLLVTAIATIAVIIIVGIRQKLPILRPRFLIFLIAFMAMLLSLAIYLPQKALAHFSATFGNFFILCVFLVFFLLALRKKVALYDTFVSGAKDGFHIAVKIIPYLVGMLVMIGVLRASGAFDLLLSLLRYLAHFLHLPAHFIDALPVALMKPLSGSGARALMIDTMQTKGADSFAGQLACIFQGSSDTTFYVISLYFGSINMRHISYTLSASLLADLVGIISAIGLGWLFFG